VCVCYTYIVWCGCVERQWKKSGSRADCEWLRIAAACWLLPSIAASHCLSFIPPALQIARAVIGCVVMAHYPLNHHPARKGWEVCTVCAAAIEAAERAGVAAFGGRGLTDMMMCKTLPPPPSHPAMQPHCTQPQRQGTLVLSHTSTVWLLEGQCSRYLTMTLCPCLLRWLLHECRTCLMRWLVFALYHCGPATP
jgi:hypothetical protein